MVKNLHRRCIQSFKEFDELSTDGEENGDILSHFADQAGIDPGVELRVTRGPIQTLQLIDEHSTFDLVNLDWQREWVGLAFACQWANHR